VAGLWPDLFEQHARLFALGFDAYRLVPVLMNFEEPLRPPLTAMTGVLSLDEEGRIRRELSWARFSRGVPVPMDPIEEADAPPAVHARPNAGTRLARRAAALAGIDPRRSLPRVTNKTFSKRFPSLPQGAGPAEVALFNDTWNEYQRPGSGVGAVRLFATAGARVLLPKVVCCGRPMLSEGLVDEARENARRNVDLLYPLVERGVPLVGLEPSCILTIRDYYGKLLPGDDHASLGPPHRGEESPLSHLHRDLVVSLLVTEESGHAATSRVDHLDGGG
jgi:hypothetical protein